MTAKFQVWQVQPGRPRPLSIAFNSYLEAAVVEAAASRCFGRRFEMRVCTRKDAEAEPETIAKLIKAMEAISGHVKKKKDHR